MEQVLRCKDTSVGAGNNCSYISYGPNNDAVIHMFTVHAQAPVASGGHALSSVSSGVVSAATSAIRPETQQCPNCGERPSPEGNYQVVQHSPIPLVPFIKVTAEYSPACGFSRVLVG